MSITKQQFGGGGGRAAAQRLAFCRLFLKSGFAGLRAPCPPLRFASFAAIFFFFPRFCFFALLFSFSIFFEACFKFRRLHAGLFCGT